MVGEMEIRERYKKTDLGFIPEEWDVLSLNDVCSRINDGTHRTPKYVNDGIPFYSVENVTADEFKITKFVSQEEHFSLIRRCNPEKGDILLTRIGTIGKTKLIDWDVNASIYVSLALLKLSRSVDSAYIYSYTKSRMFVRSVEKKSLLNAIPQKINMDNIGKVLLPIPPLPEQKSIAKTLTDTDNLILSLKKLIDKKKKIKQGAMQDLLTAKKRLPGFSGEWEDVNLGDICSRITTGKLDANAMTDDGAYRFYTCAKEYYWIDKYSFDDEALLISGNGANVGYIHYYNGKFNAYQRTYILTGFFESIIYVKYYLEKYLADRISAEVNAGNTPYIKMDTLTDMKIKLPPQKDEQNAIAQVLSDMDAEIDALEEKLEKYKTIKQGMMQELLTGRIRLI